MNFFQRLVTKSVRRPPEKETIYRDKKAGAKHGTSEERLYRNSTLFRCVDLISSSIAELDVRSEFDLDSLLEVPRAEMMYDAVTYLLMYGYAVLKIDRDQTSTLPTRVRFIQNGVSVEWDDRPRVKLDGKLLKTSEVILLMDSVRLDGWESRAHKAAPLVRTLDAINTKIENEFDKGAGSIFALMAATVIHPRRKENLVKSFREAINNKDARGVTFLDQNIQLERIDLTNPSNADLQRLRTQLISEVGSVFGVPAHLLGTGGDAKYANQTSADKAMLRGTIEPLARRIAGRFALALDTSFEFDTTALVRGDPASEIDLAVKAIQGGVLTQDEARMRFLSLDPNPELQLPKSSNVDTRESHGTFPTDDGTMTRDRQFQHFDN